MAQDFNCRFLIFNMKRSLSSIFFMLDNNEKKIHNEEELFGFSGEASISLPKYEQADIDFLSDYFSGNFNLSALNETARRFFELSANAFDILIHAWMSELPIENEIFAFGRRIIEAAENAKDARRVAEITASDRTDSNTRTVLAAAYKVQREFHRMLGFLRFSSCEDETLIARCEPDHFILPAFAGHFTERFGEDTWAIIDEKRALCLRRRHGEKAKITVYKEAAHNASGSDEWEDLWRHYHKTINNESRNNTDLQRQFIPKRYWKYLPEM
jgi:probable DNA metabolism protein